MEKYTAIEKYIYIRALDVRNKIPTFDGDFAKNFTNISAEISIEMSKPKAVNNHKHFTKLPVDL